MKFFPMVLLSFISAPFLYADQIKDIKIFGNIRIEKESILFELPFKKGDSFEGDIADASLKALNRTGYFKDISTSFQNGILTLTVQENPVINQIAYEGLNHTIREILKDIVKLKSRQVLSMAAVREAQQNLLDVYRSQGYLNAVVIPKVVRLPDNRVDLVFEIKEGKGAYIKRIDFIGNNHFAAQRLRDFMDLQERRWYHFKIFRGIVSKVYDPEKFMNDQKNLIKFYLNHGYADFEIVSATAELSQDKKEFYITYKINEGDIYKFGNISVEANLDKLPTKILQSSLLPKKGLVFNHHIVDVCCNILKEIARHHGYNFIQITPVFTKNNTTKTVDVRFVVEDRAKVFIERIEIAGNTGTRDFVIRREIGFDEGDPFDQRLLKGAEDRIKNLGFFKTVKIEPQNGSDPSKVVIHVQVEEQKTAEIFANAGYVQYDGATVSIHMYNPNLVGRGQSFGVDWALAKRTADFAIDFLEPHFLNRNLTGQTSLFYNRSKRFTGLVRKQIGGLVGLGYPIRPRLTQHWAYKLHREEVSRDSKKEKKFVRHFLHSQANLGNEQLYEDWLETDDGKDFKKLIDPDDVGTHWGSTIIHTIAYDRRNRRVLPSKGFRLSWKTQVAGLGGSIFHLINTWSGSWHQKIYKGLTLNLRASFSHAMGLGDHDLRVVDALFVGGDSLRGFDFYGVTPVRGLPTEKIQKAFDQFMKSERKFLTQYQNDFLNKNFEKLRNMIVTSRSGTADWDFMTALEWSQILRTSMQHGQKDAMQIRNFQCIKGRKVGGTLAWNGSVELTFPMPILPRDAGVFGTVFFDMGSAWRSLRKDASNPILHDDYELRTSVGFSVAWDSPFGMISLGYAWPVKKTDHDATQKFLFGYGMKFN